MNYTLTSYGDFTVEQKNLAADSRKKAELERASELQEVTISHRIKLIQIYYLRLSWIHKRKFLLSILNQITCFSTLLQVISYISTLYGKMAMYTDVSPHARDISQQILLDHDRTMQKECLNETACEDIKWIGTLDKYKQISIVMDLLSLGGGGLMRKLYIPLVTMYNRKIIEDEKMKEQTGNTVEEQFLEDLFNNKAMDDSDKYPQDHPLSIEVEKMRKKWEEMIEKYRCEIFDSTDVDDTFQSVQKPEQFDKKTKTKGKSSETTKSLAKQNKKEKDGPTDHVDWLQMLPVWIIKKIFSYLDNKTLINVKKVNSYWSYASDSILKEQQARKFLEQSIEKMRRSVDPEILKQFDEGEEVLEEFCSPEKNPRSPWGKRLKKLMNRGAILKQMVPKVKQSQQIETNFFTNIPVSDDMHLPLNQLKVFPRLIKEDLLLYRNFPCHLKDVNIIIDVQDDIQKQRDTLSYSLSQQLSDTFSKSEINLDDW